MIIKARLTSLRLLPGFRAKKYEACQGFASYRASGASHFALAQSASCGIAALHFPSRLVR